ncbi:peptide ABC transporter substrate-binding protein [Synergistales bacterium]|nr:peptide ABC transporter substrate-binding protein [Synergistales bacterium]
MKKCKCFLLAVILLSMLAFAFAPVADAAEKDTLNFRLMFNCSTVSPYLQFNDADWWWQAGVYEPLVWLNDTSGAFEPMIAKEWSVSEDGLTYTFKLRDDVYFHNGEKMKASDCVFSYNLAKQAPAMMTFTSPYDKVEALDDTTFVVHLSQLYYPFLHHSSMIRIVSEKAASEQGEAFGTKVALAGTGPYYMTDYNPAVQVSLKAFDKYYRGKAAIANLNYIVMTDDSSAMIAFEKGELSILQVPSTYWADVSKSDQYKSKIVPRHELYYFIVNMNSPEQKGILSNKLVRQAIGYCIDKESIVDVVKEGLAIPYDQFMNPTITAGGPDPTIKYEYNLDKARELLKQAGYPDGVNIGTLMSFTPAEYVKMAQIIQASCAEVGIKFDIEQMEVAAGLTEMRAGRTSMAFCASSWLMDYDYIGRYFHTRNDATAFVKYKDKALIDWKGIDDGFNKGTTVKDPAERKKIYSKVEEIIMDSATYFPIMMTSFGMAWQKDLDVDTSKWGAYFMFSPYYWSWKK